MRVLFAGCKSGLSRLQDALSGDACEINEFRDGSQLLREGQSYDWLILDGRTLSGEKELAHLIQRYGDGRAPGCGVEVSENGVMQLSCGLHKLACDESAGNEKVEELQKQGTGFTFEYHAPCNIGQ